MKASCALSGSVTNFLIVSPVCESARTRTRDVLQKAGMTQGFDKKQLEMLKAEVNI